MCAWACKGTPLGANVYGSTDEQPASAHRGGLSQETTQRAKIRRAQLKASCERAFRRRLRRDSGFSNRATARVYFHRNSVSDGSFSRLTAGSRVIFAEEIGEKAPQASTVRLLGGHGYEHDGIRRLTAWRVLGPAQSGGSAAAARSAQTPQRWQLPARCIIAIVAHLTAHRWQ